MKLIMAAAGIMLLLLGAAIAEQADTVKPADTSAVGEVRIDILYDNYLYPEGETSLGGFSCLVRGAEKTILFDAGRLGDSLLANMAALDVDPEIIDAVVISHDHGDHTAGLAQLLPECDSAQVFLLESFSQELKQNTRALGGKVVENSGPVEICQDVHTTGEMQGRATEHALILKTRGGLIVITGCAHPGVVEMVRKAKELMQDEILLVMGGFHLVTHSSEAVADVISDLQELAVQHIAPTHCTGDEAIRMIAEAFGDGFVKIGVGATIRLSDLVDD
ncbi:MAG: MBL fold metallo-hydrolase [Candidatus Zixiibacteriota bacterium]|nr:MAG: MBL fold metallo-hydrolase [candidate division Zixibacteria bacterium]